MKLLNGLNQDVAHVDQPGGTYRRARNMILDDLAGAIATENAPEIMLPNLSDGNPLFANMEICGQFKIPGDRVAFGIKARETTVNQYHTATHIEQIVEMEADGTFTVLAYSVSDLGFDPTSPFQGVGYVNSADQLVLCYTDGVTRPKYVVVQEEATEAAVVYDVFPDANFPMVRPSREGLVSTADAPTGDILAGNYTFMLAYEVQDGTNNLTQYGPSMGSWQIGAGATNEDLTFRTSASMKFYGLDTSYRYVRVYAIREFNGVETVSYVDRIFITGEDMDFTYVGQKVSDATSLIPDALLISRVSYDTAGTVAVSDDRMFLGNLTSSDLSFDEGQSIANSINVNWTTDHEGLYADRWDLSQLESPDVFSQAFLNSYDLRVQDYTNMDWTSGVVKRGDIDNVPETESFKEVPSDWAGLLGGFMPGEVYALYIAFLKKDGTWTQAFHIPGGGDSGDYSSAARLNTATVASTNVDINNTSSTHNLHVSGRPGYTVNANDEYDNTDIWSDISLNNLGVRHHLMPTAKQMWESTQTARGGVDDLNVHDYRDEWAAQTLGLYFDNVIIPEETSNKIQGYKMFYAKPDTSADRRIKAYAPTWRWRTDDQTEFEDLLRIYDPYLLATKPAISGWAIEEVYKQMSYLEQGGWTMQSANVNDYAYLPENVVGGGAFNNIYREGCLGLELSESVMASDWLSSYPGTYSLSTITSYTPFNIHANLSVTTGWHVQSAFDTATNAFPVSISTLPLGDSILNANFTSTFGGFREFLDDPTATTSDIQEDFTFEGILDKSNSNYGMVYEYGTTPGASGVYYNALDGGDSGTATGKLPQGSYLGFGNMTSFSCIYKDYDNYHTDYASKTLAATNDLVRVDAAGTYRSNAVVRGGDTWIAPVVVEFLDSTGFGDDANNTTYHNKLNKTSYFTWTHILPSKNDLDGTLTLSDLANDWGDTDTRTKFFGQTFNHYNFGQHWTKLDEKKSAFPARQNTLSTSNFPNRIIRSSKQQYESTKVSWTQFAPADYYDNALGKESIRNLEDYQGELIIHHGDSIFKTRSKFNFDASGASVFVGTGDLFQAPPQELFVDVAGYAGVTHWGDTLLSRAGYTWVDRVAGRVYNLTQGLEDLSAKGMRNYFKDYFVPLDTSNMSLAAGETPNITSAEQGGFTLGLDPVNERLLITKRYRNNPGAYLSTGGNTLSYSLRNQCWASEHNYSPYQYFQTYNQLFIFNEAANSGANSANGDDNLAAVFKLNAAAPGTTYDNTGVVDAAGVTTSYVDAVFNMGGAMPKVFQNFNWLTRAGEGENAGVKTETFDRARVYNDDQISDTATSFRLTDNRWQFNQFRDVSKDSWTGSWFNADQTTFRADSVILDNSKAWYQQKRFISDYAIIRLETLNSTGNRLYLLDVGSTARRAVR